MHQNAGDLLPAEQQVVGPADIAHQAGGFENGALHSQAQRQGQRRHRPQHQGTVDSGAGFGMPRPAQASLAGGLLLRQDHAAGFETGRGAHSGIDAGVVVDSPAGKSGADEADIERGHASSSRKLRSMARAEWVMAPEETKSAPASA